MTLTDDTAKIVHDDYHRITVELLTSISEEQPRITGLLADLDAYVQILVIYTSVISTLLTMVALLILHKLYKGDK